MHYTRIGRERQARDAKGCGISADRSIRPVKKKGGTAAGVPRPVNEAISSVPSGPASKDPVSPARDVLARRRNQARQFLIFFLLCLKRETILRGEIFFSLPGSLYL